MVRVSGDTARVEAPIDPSLDYLRGHFIDVPVVPGMLILDLVAKVAEVLSPTPISAHEVTFAQFSVSVLPGQTLVLTCTMSDAAKATRTMQARGSVQGRDVCQVELRFHERNHDQC
jgi:3-hydroxymyristoyl/3-hydroxydecanoyl-(acyl carrier protein) dehydratase